MAGYARAVETDLLERDRTALEIINGKVDLPLTAHGYAGLPLVP
ncbi:MAG: hypothetical protein ACYTG0_17625 [Planctomycetota bacterium]